MQVVRSAEAREPPKYRFMAGTPRRVERVPMTASRWFAGALDAVDRDLDRYAGTYFSDELQARWHLARDGQTLVVRDLRAPARVLAPSLS